MMPRRCSALAIGTLMLCSTHARELDFIVGSNCPTNVSNNRRGSDLAGEPNRQQLCLPFAPRAKQTLYATATFHMLRLSWRVAFTVHYINALNGGRGFPVGMGGDTVRFVMHDVVYEDLTTLTQVDALLITDCRPVMNLDQRSISRASNASGIISVAHSGPNLLYVDDNGAPSFPYLFGIHVASDEYTRPILRVASFQGSLTVAIVQTPGYFFKSSCDNGYRFAQEYKLTTRLYMRDFDLGALSEAELADVARNVSDTNADVLLLCSNQYPQMKSLVAQWKALDYRPQVSKSIHLNTSP